MTIPSIMPTPAMIDRAATELASWFLGDDYQLDALHARVIVTDILIAALNGPSSKPEKCRYCYFPFTKIPIGRPTTPPTRII